MNPLFGARSKSPHNFHLSCGTIQGASERQTDSFGYFYGLGCWSCLQFTKPGTKFITVGRDVQLSFLTLQELSTRRKTSTHLLNNGQESGLVSGFSPKVMIGCPNWQKAMRLVASALENSPPQIMRVTLSTASCGTICVQTAIKEPPPMRKLRPSQMICGIKHKNRLVSN